jgi:diguanylate cyclase (GGDEF)-like protein
VLSERRGVSGRALWLFFVPGSLLLAAAILTASAGVSAEIFDPAVWIYSYAVLGAGILVGWRFRRSRLVFVVVALAAADAALSYAAGGDAGSPAAGRAVYSAVTVLLPLNLLAISAMRERAILTWGALWRLAAMLLQVPVVALACSRWHADVCALLGYRLVPFSLHQRVALPQIGLVAAGFSLAGLLVGTVKRGGRTEAGLFWTLIGVLVALCVTGSDRLSTLYLATAGLVFVAAVIEDSVRMAYHDALTGLPARRALDEALLGLGNHYAIAMVDIDSFKRINDRHGHEVGDQALRMVSVRLRELGGGAKVFRYAGDEFTVLFPGKSKAAVLPHLRRLRKAVSSSGFYVRSRTRRRTATRKPTSHTRRRKRIGLRLSIGLAERGRRYSTPQDVLKAADNALYRAKRAGRNRIAT